MGRKDPQKTDSFGPVRDWMKTALSTTSTLGRGPHGLVLITAATLGLLMFAVNPVSAQTLCDAPGGQAIGVIGGLSRGLVSLVGALIVVGGLLVSGRGGSARGASGRVLMLLGGLVFVAGFLLPDILSYISESFGAGGGLSEVGLGCMFGGGG